MELIPPKLVIILVVALIIAAVLYFFIGRGLLKLQQWARITTIILFILGIIKSLMIIDKYQFIRGIVGLVICVLVAIYLIFNKNVRKAFA